MHQAMEKVPEGKLLKVKVDVFNKKIKSIEILGDFFAHPEECIKKIEDQLYGLDVPFEEKKIVSCLTDYIKRNDFQLIGIDPESIVRVLLKAISIAQDKEVKN